MSKQAKNPKPAENENGKKFFAKDLVKKESDKTCNRKFKFVSNAPGEIIHIKYEMLSPALLRDWADFESRKGTAFYYYYIYIYIYIYIYTIFGSYCNIEIVYLFVAFFEPYSHRDRHLCLFRC